MKSSAGTEEKKKKSLSPNQQALVTSSQVKVDKARSATPSSRQFLCSFNECLGMGSVVSTSPKQQQQQQQQQQQPTSNLEQKVTELENEVQKQKEIRTMYQKRMERTQDYLRYCLQIAQENGLLDLIINSKFPISPNVVVNVNASLPASFSPQSDLAMLINQAKMHGWYIDPVEIKLQAMVGQGSTADIYRGIWRGNEVAVKCIYPDFFHKNENGVSFFAQEVETLARQRHRFILQLMGACLDPPAHAWVVTEFLSMTLKDWLHGHGNNRRKERTTPLPPFEERLSKALEIAQAMQYLHEQNPKVIHRDLKPSNIFLDDAMHVRVADFGHARFLAEEEMALTGETGTYVYMAPEVIRFEPYNEKCDVYSFGIILNELITGNHPYVETDYGPARIALEVGEGKLRPELPDDNGKLGELIQLICLSWDADASLRPTFANITSTLRNILNQIKQIV